MFRITATNISQRFERRRLFSDLAIDLRTGDSLAVTGPNGSGKSTLLLILARLLSPTKGQVQYYRDENVLEDGEWRGGIGFVAPYMNLYDQLSGEENLKFFAGLTGLNLTGKRTNELLELVGLSGRGHDLVGQYSSGMKQRLKYAVSLRSDPAWLFLDEPTANLDEPGKEMVRAIIERQRSKCVVVIATNEAEEYELAQQQCQLD
jgi:heme exporter protein A